MTTDSLKGVREELFNLIKRDAFFKEKIVLSSGKESDYYIDARRITLTSHGALWCAQIMLDLIKDENYDAIGGPTLGADPLVGAIGVVALQAGRPVKTFIIRKNPKAHGKQQQIEGPPLYEGAKVVLIDDVATTGKAFVESLDVLSKAGIKADKALCIVDRQEGAKEALAQRQCELVSIFGAKDFLTE